MKRLFAFMSRLAFLILVSVLCSCQSEKEVPVVGSLTAYYAKEDFKAGYGEYKKSGLICDSNDPLNRVVEKDANNYNYEGDDGGEPYSWLLPKSKVEKKTYTMNQLTASDIGNKALFVANNGCVARIFWSNINCHGFYNWNGKEEMFRDEKRYKECFVLSVEYISSFDNKKYLFEEQLEEKQGCIELYRNNPYAGDITDSTNCRYRDLIGFIEESWLPREGWGYDKSSYSEEGKLLVDQWENEGIPDYISIAYIANQDALYMNGQLYYRSDDKMVTIPGLVDSNEAEEKNEEILSSEASEEPSEPYAQYLGKWTYYILTQGQRMRCYSAVINDDMTCVFITYTPDGDRNVINLNKCVFTDGFVYFTDDGDISIKGTPRFKLGPDGLQTATGEDMVKE